MKCSSPICNCRIERLRVFGFVAFELLRLIAKWKKKEEARTKK